MFKNLKKTLSAFAAAAIIFSAASIPAASLAASPDKDQLIGTLGEDDLFSDRDLRQEADTSEAVFYTVSDGGSVTIDTEGVYVFTGSAEEYTPAAMFRFEKESDIAMRLYIEAVLHAAWKQGRRQTFATLTRWLIANSAFPAGLQQRLGELAKETAAAMFMHAVAGEGQTGI